MSIAIQGRLDCFEDMRKDISLVSSFFPAKTSHLSSATGRDERQSEGRPRDRAGD